MSNAHKDMVKKKVVDVSRILCIGKYASKIMEYAENNSDGNSEQPTIGTNNSTHNDVDDYQKEFYRKFNTFEVGIKYIYICNTYSVKRLHFIHSFIKQLFIY